MSAIVYSLLTPGHCPLHWMILDLNVPKEKKIKDICIDPLISYKSFKSGLMSQINTHYQ
jgi:hypothetical protein